MECIESRSRYNVINQVSEKVNRETLSFRKGSNDGSRCHAQGWWNKKVRLPNLKSFEEDFQKTEAQALEEGHQSVGKTRILDSAAVKGRHHQRTTGQSSFAGGGGAHRNRTPRKAKGKSMSFLPASVLSARALLMGRT